MADGNDDRIRNRIQMMATMAKSSGSTLKEDSVTAASEALATVGGLKVHVDIHSGTYLAEVDTSSRSNLTRVEVACGGRLVGVTEEAETPDPTFENGSFDFDIHEQEQVVLTVYIAHKNDLAKEVLGDARIPMEDLRKGIEGDLQLERRRSVDNTDLVTLSISARVAQSNTEASVVSAGSEKQERKYRIKVPRSYAFQKPCTFVNDELYEQVTKGSVTHMRMRRASQVVKGSGDSAKEQARKAVEEALALMDEGARVREEEKLEPAASPILPQPAPPSVEDADKNRRGHANGAAPGGAADGFSAFGPPSNSSATGLLGNREERNTKHQPEPDLLLDAIDGFIAVLVGSSPSTWD